MTPVPGLPEIAALLNPGQAAEAAVLAERRCAALPDDADAWYLRAAAASLLGRWDEVAESCRRVVALNPGHAEAWHNLGAALARTGRRTEALQAYQHAVALVPTAADAHLALGCLAQEMGELTLAEKHLRAAAAHNPGLRDAHGHLGAVLAAQGRWPEAVQCFEALLALEPGHLSGLINYGAALRALGRHADAAAVYARALALHPDSALAQYFAASLGGAAAPARAPNDYVRQLFDDYAGRFDQQLVATLQYRIPQHLARALATVMGPGAGKLAVLDLGCGTGLAGQAVRHLAGRLVGVDLSARMLEQLRTKQLYDELHEAEIGGFLAGHAQTYDVVLAADVLIYLGDPAPVLGQVAARLRPGGVFALSVETHPGPEGFLLRSSGRYAHASDALRALAPAHGFTVAHWEEVVVRVEGGLPIPGGVLVLRKS